MAHRSDALSMVPVLALLVSIIASYPRSVQSIGVCYGMLGNNLPSQADVVKLYQSNGITGMRIYSADSATLNALKGTNINLIMDVGLSDASSSSAADTWVNNNVKPYYPDVSFKYIAVGNEVSGGDVSNILPAMKNIYNSLSSAGLGSIQVSTSVAFGVLGTSYPPSAGAFSSDASYMTDIVQYLASINAPLLANIYPYFSYAGNTAQISLEYALFTSPGTVVTDGSNNYQNLFDAQVDALYSAMEKVGGSNVGIVISESGWPSAGGTDTTVDNAQKYNQNLINHVGKGTPKKPTPLETYIFAMFNENEKSAGVEQNWGLFNPNQQPVYSINFN
ncbi:glucan endo-1,3-beta-glucosidase-like isoform X1 [Carex littledalei]|uniref:Glucan endo-1,3-beta-glucosidase-like isoform X1 n=1 Tax=Carex littledalei TaxID=544730 RepID=A0A833R1W5_9POAL|nr:glucan endo-1,3-beta-glucosidase-like isoform X1 [Carex littledalei]